MDNGHAAPVAGHSSTHVRPRHSIGAAGASCGAHRRHTGAYSMQDVQCAASNASSKATGSTVPADLAGIRAREKKDHKQLAQVLLAVGQGQGSASLQGRARESRSAKQQDHGHNNDLCQCGGQHYCSSWCASDGTGVAV